jgi:hypothetical protein
MSGKLQLCTKMGTLKGMPFVASFLGAIRLINSTLKGRILKEDFSPSI